MLTLPKWKNKKVYATSTCNHQIFISIRWPEIYTNFKRANCSECSIRKDICACNSYIFLFGKWYLQPLRENDSLNFVDKFTNQLKRHTSTKRNSTFYAGKKKEKKEQEYTILTRLDTSEEKTPKQCQHNLVFHLLFRKSWKPSQKSRSIHA